MTEPTQQSKTIIQNLFKGITDTTLTSCIEGVMGKVYCDDGISPTVAAGVLAEYIYIGGECNKSFLSELFSSLKSGEYTVVTPSKTIQSYVKEFFSNSYKETERYQTKKNEFCFDEQTLLKNTSSLPDGFLLKQFDKDMFNQAKSDSLLHFVVGGFENDSEFLSNGLGYGIMYDGKLICATTSFAYYSGGYEIGVATKPEYRRRGLALCTSSAFILETLKRNKLPSWDAAHKGSLALAEKLGFIFDFEYIGIEIKV